MPYAQLKMKKFPTLYKDRSSKIYTQDNTTTYSKFKRPNFRNFPTIFEIFRQFSSNSTFFQTSEKSEISRGEVWFGNNCCVFPLNFCVKNILTFVDNFRLIPTFFRKNPTCCWRFPTFSNMFPTLCDNISDVGNIGIKLWWNLGEGP